MRRSALTSKPGVSDCHGPHVGGLIPGRAEILKDEIQTRCVCKSAVHTEVVAFEGDLKRAFDLPKRARTLESADALGKD